MVEHLVGLQAQDNLPPYLGLAARLEGFDPYDVTRGLEDRSLVRLLTMRSTVHLLVADDALVLRRFTRPIHERERKVSQMVRAAIDVDLGEFSRRGAGSARRRPPAREAARRGADRDVPRRPRQRPGPPGPGGRTARPAAAARLLEAAGRRRLPVRRRLGRAADGRARPGGDRAALPHGVRSRLRRRRDLLVRRARHARRAGRHGRPGPAHRRRRARSCSTCRPACWSPRTRPRRCASSGLYDNVWLSHAGRDRVTHPDKRKRWMGVNGGLSSTLFVDGWLEGLWRVEDGKPVVVELFRSLTRQEKSAARRGARPRRRPCWLADLGSRADASGSAGLRSIDRHG